MNVDNYDAAVAVPSFAPRMVFTVCGAIGADLRPNWNERTLTGAFTGRVQWGNIFQLSAWL